MYDFNTNIDTTTYTTDINNLLNNYDLTSITNISSTIQGALDFDFGDYDFDSIEQAIDIQNIFDNNLATTDWGSLESIDYGELTNSWDIFDDYVNNNSLIGVVEQDMIQQVYPDLDITHYEFIDSYLVLKDTEILDKPIDVFSADSSYLQVTQSRDEPYINLPYSDSTTIGDTNFQDYSTNLLETVFDEYMQETTFDNELIASARGQGVLSDELLMSMDEVYGTKTRNITQVELNPITGLVTISVDAEKGFMDIIGSVLTIATAVMSGGVSGAFTVLKEVGSMQRDQFMFDPMRGGSAFQLGDFANTLDIVAEKIGINGSRGLSEGALKTVTSFEAAYSSYLAINAVKSGLKLTSLGMEYNMNVATIAGVFTTFNGYSTILDNIEIIESMNLTNGNMLDDMYGPNGWYTIMDNIGGVIDQITNIENVIIDDIKRKTKAAAQSETNQILLEQQFDKSMIKKLTLDSVGSLAGSHIWNNKFGGQHGFNPLASFTPTMFSKGLQKSDKHAGYWVRNVSAVTDIHSIRLDQFAGSRDFLEKTTTGFHF